MEIVMNDVHQRVRLNHLVDELVRWRLGVVELRPLGSELEGLVLPGHKADRFHDRGLDDFLAGEHTPGHGVRTFGVCVGLQVTAFVDDIVGDVGISLNILEEELQKIRVDEELEIGLCRQIMSKNYV